MILIGDHVTCDGEGDEVFVVDSMPRHLPPMLRRMNGDLHGRESLLRLHKVCDPRRLPKGVVP
jgi:hypothetical protein